MWVVVVGIVPILLEYLELKCKVSDKKTALNIIRLFACSGFSVVVYLMIFSPYSYDRIIYILGIPFSILCGRLIGNLVVKTEIEILDKPVEEQLGTSFNMLKISLIIFIIALIFNIYVNL